MGLIDKLEKYNDKMRSINSKKMQENGLYWKIIKESLKMKIANLFKKKEKKEYTEKQ